MLQVGVGSHPDHTATAAAAERPGRGAVVVPVVVPVVLPVVLPVVVAFPGGGGCQGLFQLRTVVKDGLQHRQGRFQRPQQVRHRPVNVAGPFQEVPEDQRKR